MTTALPLSIQTLVCTATPLIAPVKASLTAGPGGNFSARVIAALEETVGGLGAVVHDQYLVGRSVVGQYRDGQFDVVYAVIHQ